MDNSHLIDFISGSPEGLITQVFGFSETGDPQVFVKVIEFEKLKISFTLKLTNLGNRTRFTLDTFGCTETYFFNHYWLKMYLDRSNEVATELTKKDFNDFMESQLGFLIGEISLLKNGIGKE